ncbi:MAG: polysulfide reductase NrfD [Candidatus Hydrogenedentes bacterium]|nr:polysulfide reductase NrfD [Candidatus Hydrogenedentota bacterium]
MRGRCRASSITLTEGRRLKLVRDYIVFLCRAFVLSFSGTRRFYGWMTLLSVVSGIGLYAYSKQLAQGLTVTGLTDQVSWGAYIANFTYLVGVAAAAVMLVIPAYIYRNKEMHDVVLFGELLAIAAIVMSLLFVMVDLGRPDRFWHLVPVVGVFNFPGSMLSWDVIVLNGYLLLNLHICGYLLFMKYMDRKPTLLFYMPFVLVAIAWAVSIHTVTAFLYVGLVGRPFWNTAIVAPRFLGSAFTAGPGILILVFQIIRAMSHYEISDRALHLLRNIVTVSLLVNLFLLGCEAFKEFYSASVHSSSARYLFFGLHGHDALVPWMWSAMLMELVAGIILIIPPLARRIWFLNTACVLAIIGIWIEKGMGLIVPGFVPTPLGNIVEYTPSLNETLVCIGIWEFGLLLFSWMLHVAIPIMTGQFRCRTQEV